MSALRDFLEAELDNRGAAGSDETDYYEEARQALEAFDALVAERDALASDIAMRPHESKLAYDCREALGWSRLAPLSLMPDAIKQLVKERNDLALIAKGGGDAITKAVEAEREACAKMAEDAWSWHKGYSLAAAIRARSTS